MDAVDKYVRCPIEPFAAKPRRGKAVATMDGDDLRDSALVGFRGRGGEGERHLGQAQFEQAIAAARLAVVVAFGRRAAEDLGLAVVQSEAAIDGGDLRFE